MLNSKAWHGLEIKSSDMIDKGVHEEPLKDVSENKQDVHGNSEEEEKGISNEEEEKKAHKRQSHKRRRGGWTETEDEKLFKIFKEQGSRWKSIASEFPGRTENDLKNRFYSTLRRVATKVYRQSNNASIKIGSLGKEDLIQFVDKAHESGHNCFSKRGRRKNRRRNIANKKQEEAPDKKKEIMPRLPSPMVFPQIYPSTLLDPSLQNLIDSIKKSQENAIKILMQYQRVPIYPTNMGLLPYYPNCSLVYSK